jgi:hypothetical protein
MRCQAQGSQLSERRRKGILGTLACEGAQQGESIVSPMHSLCIGFSSTPSMPWRWGAVSEQDWLSHGRVAQYWQCETDHCAHHCDGTQQGTVDHVAGALLVYELQ